MNSYISYTTLSDQNLLCLNLDFSRVERGQSIWIFNNELLKDNVFCDSIIDVINKASDCPLFDTETLVWWDNIKYKMKKMCSKLCYSKT